MQYKEVIIDALGVLNKSEYKTGAFHFIKKYSDGKIEYESYRLNGELHRENGAAFLKYHENGTINTRAYYLNGLGYSKEEYDKQVKHTPKCADTSLAGKLALTVEAFLFPARIHGEFRSSELSGDMIDNMKKALLAYNANVKVADSRKLMQVRWDVRKDNKDGASVNPVMIYNKNEAKRIMSHFKKMYQCKLVLVRVSTWLKEK